MISNGRHLKCLEGIALVFKHWLAPRKRGRDEARMNRRVEEGKKIGRDRKTDRLTERQTERHRE